jgi:hypothetical protein
MLKVSSGVTAVNLTNEMLPRVPTRYFARAVASLRPQGSNSPPNVSLLSSPNWIPAATFPSFSLSLILHHQVIASITSANKKLIARQSQPATAYKTPPIRIAQLSETLSQSSVAISPSQYTNPSPKDTPRNSSLCQSKISRPTVRASHRLLWPSPGYI